MTNTAVCLQQQCYEQSSCPLIWDKTEQILDVEYSTAVKKAGAAPQVLILANTYVRCACCYFMHFLNSDSLNRLSNLMM